MACSESKQKCSLKRTPVVINEVLPLAIMRKANGYFSLCTFLLSKYFNERFLYIVVYEVSYQDRIISAKQYSSCS